MNIPKAKKTLSVFMLLLVVTFSFLIHDYIFSRKTNLGSPKPFQNIIRDELTNLPKRIINKDPCVDIYDLNPKKPAAASKSNMSLLQPVNKAFQLGDDIMVRIKLYDGDGKPKLVGGDHVRVWMVDKSKKASSAGYVIDHGNGSYTGHLKALWVGSPVIRGAIAVTCEAIGIMHTVFKVPGKLIGVVGVFQWEKISEETVCRPSLASLDFKGKFCNLTAENYGLPWFCVHPKNKDLLCHDWVRVRGVYTFHYTKEELAIMKGHYRFKPDIGIQVTTQDKKKLFVSPPSVPCNKLPISSTWREKSPVGFFFRDRWLSTYCSYTIEDNMAAYAKCLKNRRIQFLGDSTSRAWLVYLETLLHFVRVTKFEEHRPILTRQKSHNITMFWATHGLPFLHTHKRGDNRGYSRPPHVYLDELPKGCNDIIIINLYVHFNTYTPDILRLHARALVQSVNSLMARSPKVVIAFKGFHAFQDGRVIVDDYWASVYELIIKEELAPILDKVIYLNAWDITLSSENQQFHNSKHIDKQMVHDALSFICR